jgi:hypothetical protein
MVKKALDLDSNLYNLSKKKQDEKNKVSNC